MAVRFGWLVLRRRIATGSEKGRRHEVVVMPAATGRRTDPGLWLSGGGDGEQDLGAPGEAARLCSDFGSRRWDDFSATLLTANRGEGLSGVKRRVGHGGLGNPAAAESEPGIPRNPSPESPETGSASRRYRLLREPPLAISFAGSYHSPLSQLLCRQPRARIRQRIEREKIKGKKKGQKRQEMPGLGIEPMAVSRK
ncbi:hypothetical protein CASFOL_024008 [Castilleja foliolosa]|uniref:Uncharacterized protein n=1 Tax=Castilleja foliolosa TaxID=1961234 RepID=A0ABD3CPC9_9LAMI